MSRSLLFNTRHLLFLQVFKLRLSKIYTLIITVASVLILILIHRKSALLFESIISSESIFLIWINFLWSWSFALLVTSSLSSMVRWYRSSGIRGIWWVKWTWIKKNAAKKLTTFAVKSHNYACGMTLENNVCAMAIAFRHVKPSWTQRFVKEKQLNCVKVTLTKLYTNYLRPRAYVIDSCDFFFNA